MFSVVFDPTPTMSVALGVVPDGGSARATPAVRVVTVATTAAPVISLPSMRIFRSSCRRKRVELAGPISAGRRAQLPVATTARQETANDVCLNHWRRSALSQVGVLRSDLERAAIVGRMAQPVWRT